VFRMNLGMDVGESWCCGSMSCVLCVSRIVFRMCLAGDVGESWCCGSMSCVLCVSRILFRMSLEIGGASCRDRVYTVV
jgi:hypothetical protein